MKIKNLLIILILFASKLLAQPVSLGNYYFNIKSTGSSRLEKIFTTDENILNKPDEQVKQNFEGIITFTTLKKYGSTSICEVKITTSKYELNNGNNEPLEAGFLIAHLELPFYVTINKYGGIILFAFDKAINENTQKILKELLTHFQINKISHVTYTHIMQTPTGNVLVQFKQATKISTLKTNLNFINNDEVIGNNELATTLVPSGSVLIHWYKQNNTLKSITGTETTTVLLNNKVAGTAANIVCINTVNAILPSAKIIIQKLQNYELLKSQYQMVKMYEPITTKQVIIEARKRIIKNDTYEKLIAKLSTNSNNPNDSLYLKVRALVTVYPTLSYTFLPMLDTSKATSNTYSVLWMSLLHAESPEATNAICSILVKHKDDWEWSKNIIANLGVAKIVTDTMIDALKQIHKNSTSAKIVRTTELALGSLVDNLSKQSSTKSNSLYKWLLAHINMQTTNENVIMQNILVLANTNTLQAKREIKKYTIHTNIAIKERAEQALQNLK